MQGGKLVADGITRNDAGYPLDSDGQPDLIAAQKEAISYLTRVTSAQATNRGTNQQPPKKKRK